MAAYCVWAGVPVLDLTTDGVVRFAAAWAPWSAVASMVLMVLHSFLPFPAEVIAIANGVMFGPAVGVLVTWSSAMLGAILAFGMARHVGRPVLRVIVSNRYRQAVEGWQPRWSTLLVVRLIPVISFNLVNYGAGLARVGWWPYLWTTGVGILPLTVVSVGFGSSILRIGWGAALAAVIAAVLLWLVARGPVARHLLPRLGPDPRSAEANQSAQEPPGHA